ncbi:hypothetical protein FGRMN_10269 [Fusarium graminum]|nr:hypothetical protein FGRMN_10269 [Fusarium graminum]
MASLTRLPQEISTIILDQVNPRDWLSLKQTCKKLQAETAHLVNDFFFRTRVVMLERRSLQCLESIANDKNLSQMVHEVEVCTSHLLPVDELEKIKPQYSEYEGMMKNIKKDNDMDAIRLLISISEYKEWVRRWPINNGEGGFGNEGKQDDRDGQDSQGIMDTDIIINNNNNNNSNGRATRNRLEQIHIGEYSTCLREQQDMIDTGYDKQSLARAMKLLQRCKSIRISTGIHAWGLNRLRRRIGILPQRGLTFKSNASIRQVCHIIQVVFEAMASSGIPVECLEIEAGVTLENANRILPRMLMGPPSCSIRTGARSFPSSLRQLQISLDPTGYLNDAESSLKWGVDLIRFMQLLPELSTLDLGFENRDEVGRFSSAIAKKLYIPKSGEYNAPHDRYHEGRHINLSTTSSPNTPESGA